jgi:hypothetical protein
MVFVFLCPFLPSIFEIPIREHTEDHAAKLHALWGKTNYLRVGRKLSRDEMNER